MYFDEYVFNKFIFSLTAYLNPLAIKNKKTKALADPQNDAYQQHLKI